MINRLKWFGPEGRTYDPDLLRLMQTAFDQAWEMQNAGNDPSHEKARDHLANAILDVVDRGERDLAKVRSYALGELLRFRNAPQANNTKASHSDQ